MHRITLYVKADFDHFIKRLDDQLKMGLIKILSFRMGFGHKKEVEYMFWGMDNAISIVLD